MCVRLHFSRVTTHLCFNCVSVHMYIYTLYSMDYCLQIKAFNQSKARYKVITTHTDASSLSIFEDCTNCSMHPFNYSLIRLIYTTMFLQQFHLSSLTQPTTTLSCVTICHYLCYCFHRLFQRNFQVRFP